MTIRETEAVAVRIVDWLTRLGYRPTQTPERKPYAFDGRGSVHLLSRSDLVVEINNDRGTMLVALGRGAERGERLYGLSFWALCLGYQTIAADIDWSKSTAEDQARWTAEQESLLHRVVEAAEKLPPSTWPTIESCIRQKDEAYWRAHGMWPLPEAGSVMRPKNPDE